MIVFNMHLENLKFRVLYYISKSFNLKYLMFTSLVDASEGRDRQVQYRLHVAENGPACSFDV